MSRPPTWRDRLAPFAQQYEQLHADLAQTVKGMSDSELNKLAEATDRPTQTNCSWSAYYVAPLVNDAVARERYARKLATKEARSAADGKRGHANRQEPQ